MPTIDIQADTKQAASAMNSLTAQLGAIKDRIEQVTSTVNTFNRAGNQISSTIQGMTKDGKEFTATFKRYVDSNGQFFTALKNIKFKDQLTDVVSKSIEWEEVLGRISRGLQYFVTYRAFNFISNQIEQGIASAKDFQVQLSLIRTISQDAQQSFSKFGSDVRGVSDRSGIDINQVGKAFYDTISNQVARGADTAPFVEQAANLARVTGSELPDSVNLLSSAINAYGLSVSDAERLSAIFFKTIDEGRVVSSELANTFGRVAVLGSNLGVSIEELNSVIAITTQKGFKTADALTLLTNLLIKLEKPTDATQAFFESLGVNTGEAAIKLLGFNGVLRKMVEAVKTGQVDVSAFFDEIRGRKQFGVFEQSIDQIERFAGKLSDTTGVIKTYNDAVAIRGESSADKLVKEFNKVSNIFTVEFGQRVLEITANMFEFVGGTKGIENGLSVLVPVAQSAAIALGAYTAAAIAGKIATFGFAGSLNTLGKALLFAAPALGVFGGLALGDSLQEIWGLKGIEDAFGKVDLTKLDATGEALERLKRQFQGFNEEAKKDTFAGLNTQSENLSKTFREISGTIAKATIANKKFLDEAKENAKRVNESIKIGFGTYSDGIKNGIKEIRKGVTEANTEIDKSTKKMLGFRETLDKLLFDTKFKYANEEFGGEFGGIGGQKDLLLKKQAENLKSRAAQLFGVGTPEAVDEARQLFDEIAKIEKDRFELQTDLQKKQAEAAGATGLFLVDTLPLEQKLNKLLAERTALEEKYTNTKKAQIVENQALDKSETERLRKLEQALQSYEKLDIFDKAGSIKSEFRGQGGKFAPDKLQSELGRLEKDIRESAGTPEERIAIETLLWSKRQSLFKEAQAQERADYLKTTEQRLLGEEEVYKKRIEDIKRVRQEQLAFQKTAFEALGNKPQELAGFADKAIRVGGVSNEDQLAIYNKMGAFQESLKTLFNDKAVKDGVAIFKPENLEAARQAYTTAVDTIIKARDNAGRQADLTLQDASGRAITPGGGKAAFDLQVQEITSSWIKVMEGITQEKTGATIFDQTIRQPFEQLKASVPELANVTKSTTEAMGQSFKDLAAGGLEDMRKQLEEINRLLQMGGVGINAETASYMATGGVVGAFPGKPRGQDRYPIWAARGEYVVNAQSAAMFKPMLDSINYRRTPRYMANGGIVGGDTNIGDINVNVSGGNNGIATGRTIASTLERELRRRTINLNRR